MAIFWNPATWQRFPDTGDFPHDHAVKFTDTSLLHRRMDCGPPFFPSLPSLSPCPVRSAAISHLICLLHVYRDTHTHTPKISSLFFLICFCHCPCVFFFSSPSHPLIVYVFHTKCLATARQVHCFIHPQRSSVLDSKYRNPREKNNNNNNKVWQAKLSLGVLFIFFLFSKNFPPHFKPKHGTDALWERDEEREGKKPLHGNTKLPDRRPHESTSHTQYYSIFNTQIFPLTASHPSGTHTHARTVNRLHCKKKSNNLILKISNSQRNN